MSAQGSGMSELSIPLHFEYGRMAKLVKAPVSQAGDYGFESHSDHNLLLLLCLLLIQHFGDADTDCTFQEILNIAEVEQW